MDTWQADIINGAVILSDGNWDRKRARRKIKMSWGDERN